MQANSIRLAFQSGVANIIIDREDKINALDMAMMRRLIKIFKDLALDNNVRVVALQGVGQHFSAGGDMSDIIDLLHHDPNARRIAIRTGIDELSRPLALAINALPQPLLASVRGHVIGLGLQLVAMSDLVIASETACFRSPQVVLGHTPDHGESWSLVRRIGISRAMQMILTGDQISAIQAERFSLVNWVIPDNDLDRFASELARQMAAKPPLAIQSAKALFRAGACQRLEVALTAEAAATADVAATSDFVEAITAFQERRSPVFTGS